MLNFRINREENKEQRRGRFYFLILLLLCWLPNLLIVSFSEKATSHIFYFLGLLILSSLSILCLASLLKRSFPFIGWIFIILFPSILMPILIKGDELSFGLIQSTFESNMGEIKEILGILLLGALLTFSYFGIYYFFFKRHRKTSYTFSASFRYLIYAVFSIFLILVGTNAFCQAKKDISFVEKFQFSMKATAMKFEKVYPFNVFFQLGKYISFVQEERALSEKIGEFNFSLVAPEWEEAKQPIIIYVLGETSNKSHWQLFGYSRPTTPQILKEQNKIAFSNVWTGANFTAQAVPMLISRSNPENLMAWAKEGTLTHFFHQAGFRTVWLANQSSDFLVGQISSQQSDTSFYTHKEYDSTTAYDESLFKPFEDVLSTVQKEGAPAYILLHTLGSHFRYDSRNPKSFDLFTPTIRGMLLVEAKKKKHRMEFINSYDNTIVYTDYFLTELFSRIKFLKRPAVLLYVADHGEALGEIDEDQILHSSQYPLLDELEVPVVLFYNDSYKEQNAELLQVLEERNTASLGSYDLPSLLVALSGVSSTHFNFPLLNTNYRCISRSYITPNLVVHREKNKEK